ncbi:MAG: hypothetical protein COT84_01665 [Chlamydiae bacterium CG10_big_fil_rev_8_21_14_0_10_35_9]|nr:MAG: hypothetical protein COT84_01665 [Chlamydiae bacterium CG10_big_fil_rev_8_21_14_0_10_35_9]
MNLNVVKNNLNWVNCYPEYSTEVKFSSLGNRLLIFKHPDNTERSYSINALAKECFQVLSGLKKHEQSLAARDVYLKLYIHNQQLNNKLSNESFIVRIFVWIRDLFSYQNILNKRKPLTIFYKENGSPINASFS